MLKRLRSALSGDPPKIDVAGSEARAAAARAFLIEPVDQMAPLAPPEAVNDDPMGSVYVEVEHELRLAGYLR